ncbi:carbonic anhydrase [Pluteus cervinus]|uniref:Carbonic anhydrase n=1 Tax=Pluteus cervinus TaxID=181527 RepID=A0ACD3B4D0_9AGAR|nr:carbonic anhydrase [Pluteus cervinus]
MLPSRLFFTAFLALSSVAHPIHHQQEPRELRIVGRDQSATVTTARRGVQAPELNVLFEGNQKFRETISAENPGILKQLSDDGQKPPFMFIGCSDSRVSEGTVFKAQPGTLFTERNIANQFHNTDSNAHSILSYAVSVLGVKHVIVMGHYGCGGVAAAIASPPESPVDAAFSEVENWIEPIRALFQASSRPEIVELREKIKGQTNVPEPEIQEPGFRALVEENIKQSVNNIAKTSVLANHYHKLSLNGTTSEKRSEEEAPLVDVYVHGWVYDIETGEIRDLGISVGPPGKEIPATPFEAVAKAAEGVTGGNSETPAHALKEGIAGTLLLTSAEKKDHE